MTAGEPAVMSPLSRCGLNTPNKTGTQVGKKAGWVACHGIESKQRLGAPPVSPKAVNASGEFLGQCDDDARRASHVAEPVNVLVLDHLADEFAADGAQPSDSVVDAFDRKHDAPQAQRFGGAIAGSISTSFGLRNFVSSSAPVPIWGPHHNDVHLDIFDPVDPVHPRALDRRLAFDRHAERGEKSDSRWKVVDDDADVIQSLDRHVPSIAEAVRGGPGRQFARVGYG